MFPFPFSVIQSIQFLMLAAPDILIASNMLRNLLRFMNLSWILSLLLIMYVCGLPVSEDKYRTPGVHKPEQTIVLCQGPFHAPTGLWIPGTKEIGLCTLGFSQHFPVQIRALKPSISITYH